jgi:tetratricopeptide (TPR) repeat protein
VKKTTGLSVGFLIFCLFTSPPSFAQDDAKKLEQAQDIFIQAQTFYNTGDYANALELFKEAYRLTFAVDLLFNIAQCQRQLNLLDEARKSYNRVIHASSEPEIVKQSKEWIESIDNEIAKRNALGSIQVLTNPDSAIVFVDNNRIGAAPIDLGDINPGEHTISVQQEGFYPYELRFELQPGQAFSIRVPLRPEVKTEERDLLQPKYFYLGAAGSGALGIAFGGTALGFALKANEQQQIPGIDNIEDTMRTAEQLSIVSNVLVGLSVAAISSGFFLKKAQKQKKQEACVE